MESDSETFTRQLNNKLLTKEQIELFEGYIKNFADRSELREELIFLLNDYNNIIRESIGYIEQCRKSQGNDDIAQMKLTNDILKKVEFTRNNPHIFSTKYSNGDYKEFLNNLVNYNYSISTLHSINNDIKKYDYQASSNPYPPSSPKAINKTMAHVSNFNTSLRQHDTLNDQIKQVYLNKKPFHRFTPLYGNYFDKKLNHASQIV